MLQQKFKKRSRTLNSAAMICDFSRTSKILAGIKEPALRLGYSMGNGDVAPKY